MVVDFGNGVGRWGGEVGPPPTYPKTTTENSDANGGNEEEEASFREQVCGGCSDLFIFVFSGLKTPYPHTVVTH